MPKIIYEDNHLLVVEKPVNMPVQADASGDPDLLSELKRYIKEKYNKPGEVYLGLVHRLDRPVGGVMVFARTSKAAARLTEAVKARKLAKKYAAIVDEPMPAFGSLTDYMVRDEATHSSRIVDKNAPGAQLAKLDFALAAEKNGRSLVDISLQTGRHHQIRVQFAGMGKPLYGDQRYNKTARVGQQIALYAYSLTLEHPTLHESLTFTSIPSGASWAGFSEELIALTNGLRCPYVDENLIAVNKQPGISVAVADGGEDTLEARLSLAFGEAYPVHRLDAATSGLVLFARSEAARDALMERFASRDIKKLYKAYVFGEPQKREGVLILHAEKDAEGAKVSVFNSPTKHSREMKTGYRVVKSFTLSGEKVSLLEIELLTGRTHQIRASFAHIGCPVVGDDKYGDRRKNRLFPDRLLLAAVRVELPAFGGALSNLSGKSISIEPPFGVDSSGELSVCRV